MKLNKVLLSLPVIIIATLLFYVAPLHAQPPGNAMDHPVLVGERAGDHPVLMGERAGDMSGSMEHLAPLIFMVIAFVVTIITGVVVWERGKLWKNVDFFFFKVPVVPALIASACALIALLLLGNVNFYLTDQHPSTDVSSHNHHSREMWLSGLAAAILFLLALLSLFGFKKGWINNIFITLSGAAEIIVIVILLNIFPHHQFFKMCNGQCVMRGSQAGVTFDLPCADNVAFMALHHTTGITAEDYVTSFGSASELPHFLEYSSAIPIHDPLYPRVNPFGGATISEPITFSLEESVSNPVAACSLYVLARTYTKAQLEDPSFSFPEIPENPASLTAVWNRSGATLTKTFPAASVVDNISHTRVVAGQNNMVTYVSYKFKVSYTNPPGEATTPPEDIEVSFVLQDYYSIFPEFPAPVYAQGDMRDAMDILFIPAQSDAPNDPLDPAFFAEFRESCRGIIKDAVFQEPSIRYWRKHFNFWINPKPGRALDGRCGDCCHVAPENMDYISSEIEFRALLHKDAQLDFTDHCNKLFSAEMKLVNDHDEKSSFLHELGHAAFGLADEYPRGFNYQATDHLPNNWASRSAARQDAHFRHKHESDVVRLY